MGNSPWGHTQSDAGAQLTLLLLEESKFGVSLLYRNCPDSLQSIKYGGLFIFREVTYKCTVGGKKNECSIQFVF